MVQTMQRETATVTRDLTWTARARTADEATEATRTGGHVPLPPPPFPRRRGERAELYRELPCPAGARVDVTFAGAPIDRPVLLVVPLPEEERRAGDGALRTTTVALRLLRADPVAEELQRERVEEHARYSFRMRYGASPAAVRVTVSTDADFCHVAALAIGRAPSR